MYYITTEIPLHGGAVADTYRHLSFIVSSVFALVNESSHYISVSTLYVHYAPIPGVL